MSLQDAAISLQGTETSPRSVVPVNQIDSGYASHNSSAPPTPEQKDAQGRVLSQRANLHRFMPSFGRQRLSIPANLIKYEKTLDKAVWDRYHDVLGRLKDGLRKCMNNKDGKVSQGLVIRIMVLGETCDEAKPYIIICCPKSKIKSVEEFLMEPSIKSIYQPTDLGQISFGIAVTGPPKPKNASSDFEVYGSPDCSRQVGWNSSSAIIRIIGENGERYATMGGVIKISKNDGEYVLCGLTVGHILDTIDDDDDGDDDEDDEDDEGGMSIDDGSESDHDDHEKNAGVSTYSLKAAHAVAKANFEYQSEWTKVGTITAESRPKEALDRDWALVVGLDNQFQLPNKIQQMNGSSSPQPRRELTLGTGETVSEGSTRAVLLASSILQKDAYSQFGHLSNTGAVALFGGDFVSVYTMTLDNGADLPYGSSGSWVIDKDSCEIYGHAIADDAFGDIFVVPIRDIFADIEKMEGFKEVTLPSDIDVISHRNLIKNTMELVPRASSNPVSEDQEAWSEEGGAVEVSHKQTPPESPPVPSVDPEELHSVMLSEFTSPLRPIFEPSDFLGPFQLPGQHPQSTIPQGTIPQGTIPQSTIPQGTNPQGTIPQGTNPQGTIPQVQYLQPSMDRLPQSLDYPLFSEAVAYPPPSQAQFYTHHYGAPATPQPYIPTPDLTPDTSLYTTPNTSPHNSDSANVYTSPHNFDYAIYELPHNSDSANLYTSPPNGTANLFTSSLNGSSNRYDSKYSSEFSDLAPTSKQSRKPHNYIKRVSSAFRRGMVFNKGKKPSERDETK